MSDITAMEEVSPEQETSSPSKKRPVSPTDEAPAAPNKKVRLGFSGKEFRKELKSSRRTQAVQNFLQITDENPGHECIEKYLEHGGSPLEILQLVEGESGISPVLAFDAANRILLQIGTKLGKYQNIAVEACRYLINTYLAQINTMLGLNSSTDERVVTLKLLTTIVTFSVVLAKDVLLHVNFSPLNITLLSKSKNEARGCFIHFITAFLVDGHFPTLSVLLEKKGLMTSIINGLRFDKADVVVLVLTAMKNHILENSYISKTVKMKTFSTPVVRDIVNLYNWKGPAGLAKHNKDAKVVTVNEVDKSKVNEAVHSFLLILCTSHRFGVIFKDPLVGLSTGQNPLMLTVLESLERPWEHSYAGELVTKICRACPDLATFMWAKVKALAEPRWTDKWLKCMTFAGRLLDEVQPDCVEFAVPNLNAQQISQVIMKLTSPAPVIKVLTPEGDSYDRMATKYHVMSLFLKMVTSLETFLERAKTWPVDHTYLRQVLAAHLRKNLPKVGLILSEWDKADEDVPISEYLNVAFDLLRKCRALAPKYLQEVAIDVRDFLSRCEEVVEVDSVRLVQVKAVELFIDLEPELFKSGTELFKRVLSLSMEYYHGSRDATVLRVLKLLLGNSPVFDGFSAEIDFWIDGVLNLKHFDANVASFLCDLIQKGEENAADYHKKLFELKSANFSSLIFGLADIEPDKATKSYLTFVVSSILHVQNDPNALLQVVADFPCISESLLSYISSWSQCQFGTFPKSKGWLTENFHHFSRDFLENHLESFAFDLYPNQRLHFLQAVIFYVTNLAKGDALKDNHRQNCWKFLDHLTLDKDRYVQTIVGNASLLENFTLFDSEDFSTKLILDVVKNLEPSVAETYLIELRRKVVSAVSKVFRRPEKYKIVSVEVLESVCLDYEQCRKTVAKFAQSLDNKSFYPVACHCLNRMSELGKDHNFECLSPEELKAVSDFFTLLINDQVPNSNLLSSSLQNYLKVFPHSIKNISPDLFDGLLRLPEYHRDNLSLCEFLLDRQPDCRTAFEKNLDEICSKRSSILSLLDVVVRIYSDRDEILGTIFQKIEPYVAKALQKPHKAGQHFQKHYHSVGILIEKFMTVEGFGAQIQKFEATEIFHVHLLRKIFGKVQKNAKILSNMVMTFIHLLMGLLKQKGSKPVDDLETVGGIFLEFLIDNRHDTIDLTKNETFNSFCKLCLKYGVSGDWILIKILTEFVDLCLGEEETKLILEMLLSHSQFLDLVLAESQKEEVLCLWKKICERWPQFMERSHVPVLLACYNATRSERTALDLLRRYESRPDQTKFFDFKPFIWGRAAASHYSVRSDMQNVLWRQPKMGDVLNNLDPGTIAATITDPSHPDSYDLEYFLPLFSQLLAPENPVTTYRFTKSGALALTLTGLRGQKSQRLATCHILQRFHFHLEARQSGKDNLLWLRLIEAVCKGVVVFEDFKINNFVGVFLARMALVLTQPLNVMYVALSQYLSAKDSPDFATIPELYTFLHSPHVDSIEYKHFILEVVRDGLNSDADFTTFLKTMGFKLISELCSSTVCDHRTKILILEVFERCCQSDFAVKILCGNLSFLPQVFGLVRKNPQEGSVLNKLLAILAKIVQTDRDRHRNFIVFVNLMALSEDQDFPDFSDSKSLDCYYRILVLIAERFPDFVTQQHMDTLLEKSGDKFCGYLRRFGCDFVKETDFTNEVLHSQCLRLLFYKKLQAV